MKGTFAIVAATAFVFIASRAFAQEGEPVDTAFYDFNDMLIDGDLQRPEGIIATERGAAVFDSLVNMRRSFIDEIEEAAHESALE